MFRCSDKSTKQQTKKHKEENDMFCLLIILLIILFCFNMFDVKVMEAWAKLVTHNSPMGKAVKAMRKRQMINS